jgi:hypothetical protein
MRALLPYAVTLLALHVACTMPAKPDTGSDSDLTDRDEDNYTSDIDCDDDNATVYPRAPEICTDGIDNDCDGEIDTDEDWCSEDTGEDTAAADEDRDTFTADVDCDDNDTAVFPGAAEKCNGKDDDCDGELDEADAYDASTWYADTDGDAHGDPGVSLRACDAPVGFVALGDDCDDTDANISPSAVEACNDGVDDDCDGLSDDDDPSLDLSTATTWYADEDGDDYGAPFLTARTCVAPTGFLLDNTDCDDTDASTNPGAEEYCDLVDNDCDGELDEPSAVDAQDWYADGDSDGYGDGAASTLACWVPAGHVADSSDCDDGNSAANPGLDELCTTTFDDDCDGRVNDSSAIDVSVWYRDGDGDSYTDNGVYTSACTPPSGYGPRTTEDCDDGDSSAYPGGPEDDRDLADNDCDGIADEMVTFSRAQTLSLGSGADPHFIIELSLEGDTYRDIAIAAYGTGQVLTYGGTSTGTFTALDSINAGTNTRSLANAFINSGANRDIVAVNAAVDGGKPQAWSLYTNSIGKFSAATHSSTTSTDLSSTVDTPRAVAALEDCGGTGLDFIAVGDNDKAEISFWENSSGAYTYAGVSVSTGGTGTNTGPLRFREVDLNNDGYKDLISGNGQNNTVTVVLLAYTGSCSNLTATSANYSFGYDQVSGVAVGNFDADGYPDIAAVSKASDELHLLFNDGAGGFTDGGSFNILSDHGLSSCSPEAVGVGDFNSPDEYDDIVVACQDSDQLAFYMGYGGGTFDITTTPSTGDSPREFVVYDFTSDGEDDIVVVNDGSDDNAHVLHCN